MAQNITIGFIGYGNMAQAIAQGLVDAGVVNGGDIVACAAHYDKLEASTAKLGARPLHNAREVAAAADVVIIAIKPYQIESVIKPIADEFAKNGRFVVSIAAGWDLAKYQKLFGDLAQSIHIQCTIPNTPMAVGKGVLVTVRNNHPYPVRVKVSSLTDSMEIVTSRFTEVTIPANSEAQVTFAIRVATSGHATALSHALSRQRLSPQRPAVCDGKNKRPFP